MHIEEKKNETSQLEVKDISEGRCDSDFIISVDVRRYVCKRQNYQWFEVYTAYGKRDCVRRKSTHAVYSLCIGS